MGKEPEISPLHESPFPEISVKCQCALLDTKVSLSVKVCGILPPIITVNFSNWLESSHQIHF